MTWKKPIRKCLLVAVSAVALCGCGPGAIVPSIAGKWEYREVKRIKSPDSVVEAVLFTGDAGATTATATYLYLVPAGSRLDPKKEEERNGNKACFVADDLSNLSVIWRNPRLIEIGYQGARIHHFQNMWYHRGVQDYHYVVELRLSPTTNEFALPSRDRYW